MPRRPFRDAAADPCEKTESLSAAWKRSFLNYTPEAPGHWRDPEQVYSGNMDQPGHAVPYLLRIIREQGTAREALDQVLAYLQFYAAVRQNFPTQEDTDAVKTLVKALPEQYRPQIFPDGE